MDIYAFIEQQIAPSVLLIAMLGLCGLGLHLLRSQMRAQWEPLKYFLLADVVLSAGGVILAGRDLSRIGTIYSVQDAADQLGATAAVLSRAITLALMIVCSERIIRFVVLREYRHARGLVLLLWAMLFLLVINIISPLLGKYPDFEHKYIYAPILMLGLFAYLQNGWQEIARVARNGYVVFLLLGLAFLAVAPHMVMDFKYTESIVPGFDIRFYGFATHANTLAPYCLLLLCLLWLCPFERRAMQHFAVGLALLCMLISQSKTTIAVTAVIMLVLWARRRMVALRRRPREQMSRFRVQATLAAAVAASGVGLAVLGALLVGAIDGRVLDRLATDESLWTLTGRTALWEVSLRWLPDNPFFGFGADLWGLGFQQAVGIHISHAHNQYVHTLGDSGISGLAVLVLYLAALVYFSWKVRGPTQWVSVTLAASMVLRGITEAPMITDSVFGVEFAVHMFVFALCIGSLSVAGPRPQSLRQAAPAQPVRPSAG